MSALLIVRATVAPADRATFDRWYETEHLTDAAAAFGGVPAQRGWCADDAGVHCAIYTFESVERARAVAASDVLTTLVAEFDRHFPQVRRTRDIVSIVQTL